MTNSQPAQYYDQATQLSYLHTGQQGDAVVMLHGWGGFKELWWSVLRRVGEKYRVFAPDMPGHGNSALGATSSMPEIASRIAQFCEVLGLEQVALVGHSMGGNIAVELALARPDLVRRLVLVSPAVQGKMLPFYTRSYLHQNYGYAALRLMLLLEKATNRIGFTVPHDHGGGTLLPALRRFAYEGNHDAADMHRLLRSLIHNPLTERATQISVPTLVISGGLDPLVPPALSRRLAATIPHASYREIPNAVHNAMDERPAEFSAILLEFLHETC